MEGIAENGRLSEVQRAMAEGGGSQCGYCTAGFVVSMFAEQHRCPPDQRDLHSLGGNLCRCTGYRPIQDAFLSLGPGPGKFVKGKAWPPGHPTTSARLREPCRKVSRDPCCWQKRYGSRLKMRLPPSWPAIRIWAWSVILRDIRFAHLISLEGVEELRRFKDGP